MSLSLRLTDQSGIAEGDVLLSHVKNICNHQGSQVFKDIMGVSLRALWLKGVRTLGDVGEWTIDLDGHIGLTSHPRVLDRMWSAAAKSIWRQLASALGMKVQLDDFISGPVDLALLRQLREHWAEASIGSLAELCGHPLSKYSDSSTWASDGSMLPVTAGVLDNKSVTGAVTGTSVTHR